MTSKAEDLYNKHHSEFEFWFDSIHPNHNLDFEWVYVFDSGWYKEQMINGSWIAWLSLTGRSIDYETVNINVIKQEIESINKTKQALTTKANSLLLPLADKLLSEGKLDDLKTVISDFPECSTRMLLAGKVAIYESN